MNSEHNFTFLIAVNPRAHLMDKSTRIENRGFAMGNSITYSDLMLASCAVIGPILAVQAQKFIERWQGKWDRKLAIFRTLMATRATTLSASHVEALNAVPIDFYGQKPVMDVWQKYYGHLSKDETDTYWQHKRIELFIELLAVISRSVGYKFNTTEMERIYFPKAHATTEVENHLIRQGLIALFTGNRKLHVEVTQSDAIPTARSE